MPRTQSTDRRCNEDDSTQNRERENQNLRRSIGDAVDKISKAVDGNLAIARACVGLVCGSAAIFMISKIKGMRMYKSGREIPKEIFKGRMQIQGYIVSAPENGESVLRFRHRPLGGSILQSLISSPFTQSSTFDNEDQKNTILLRPFGVDLSLAEKRIEGSRNAAAFFKEELIDCEKLVSVAPLCATNIDDELVDGLSSQQWKDADEDDRNFVVICNMSARVANQGILAKYIGFRSHADIASVLLSSGLAESLQEDQSVLMRCGGPDAFEPLLLAEEEARSAKLGLWKETSLSEGEEEELTLLSRFLIYLKRKFFA